MLSMYIKILSGVSTIFITAKPLIQIAGNKHIQM